MKGYNTNLASEYYVLSMLYRKGFDAPLVYFIGAKQYLPMDCISLLRHSGSMGGRGNFIFKL